MFRNSRTFEAGLLVLMIPYKDIAFNGQLENCIKLYAAFDVHPSKFNEQIHSREIKAFKRKADLKQIRWQSRRKIECVRRHERFDLFEQMFLSAEFVERFSTHHQST